MLRLLGKEGTKLTKNADFNNNAKEIVKYLLKNTNPIHKIGKIDGKPVNFIDYKTKEGLGMRFNGDTNEFIGFLGRNK